MLKLFCIVLKEITKITVKSKLDKTRFIKYNLPMSRTNAKYVLHRSCLNVFCMSFATLLNCNLNVRFRCDVDILFSYAVLIKSLGPGHIGSFYLLLFHNKAVFQCIPYGKPKTTSC